jgi:outer membrane protein OmpA-like peptidoglycan-associated protein
MNTANDIFNRSKSLLAIAVASILLASCATAPVRPLGADQARAKLTALQSNPDLANRAPAAIAEAEAAVVIAEQPEPDPSLAAYHVYIADRKIDIAAAQAQTKFYEDQRADLEAQQQNARLDARTHEVDVARNQAANAQADAQAQTLAASQARSDADAANATSAALTEQAAEMQRRIDDLDMKVTNRGLVLTLGDVLFATGRAELMTGATGHLDKLVDFLQQYTDRTVVVEGYTDSTGTQAYNQDLSERRAQSVSNYLSAHGVAAARISASGQGMNYPVSSNDSATGRQQNRRVEVIISNPAIAAR